MIQTDRIQDALLHLIGWKQTSNTINGAAVCKTLTDSESGMFFQQAHPLITLDNLFSIAPDFSAAENEGTYPEYNPNMRTTSYAKGTVVSSGGKLYKAIQDTIPGIPGNLPDYWAETSLFSEWVEGKVKESIAKMALRFYTEKLANRTAKAICENKTLFDGTGRLSDTITNRNNIVGFEIVPIRAKGILTKINRICLQFTKPGDYTLYLIHSSSDTPVQTIKVQKHKSGAEWISVKDLYLPYRSENTDAGGSWFLCYKQSELPDGSMAINKDKDWSKEPCKSCSKAEYISWSAWSPFLEIHPFSVKEEAQIDSGLTLWDIADNNYEYDRNYGINLDISIYCDFTDFIIQERMLFQDILLKQFAVDVLREIAYNPNVRTNRHSVNASRMDILYELDGDSSSMKKSGLSYQLDKAYESISIALRGINRICMPCKNNGIRYRAI